MGDVVPLHPLSVNMILPDEIDEDPPERELVIVKHRKTNMASYSIINVYEAHRTDGGGMGHNVGNIGFFSTPAKAHAAAATESPYSTVATRIAIQCNDDDGLPPKVFLLASPTRVDIDKHEAELTRKLRDQALKKLSSSERKALGFD